MSKHPISRVAVCVDNEKQEKLSSPNLTPKTERKVQHRKLWSGGRKFQRSKSAQPPIADNSLTWLKPRGAHAPVHQYVAAQTNDSGAVLPEAASNKNVNLKSNSSRLDKRVVNGSEQRESGRAVTASAAIVPTLTPLHAPEKVPGPNPSRLYIDLTASDPVATTHSDLNSDDGLEPSLRPHPISNHTPTRTSNTARNVRRRKLWSGARKFQRAKRPQPPIADNSLTSSKPQEADALQTRKHKPTGQHTIHGVDNRRNTATRQTSLQTHSAAPTVMSTTINMSKRTYKDVDCSNNPTLPCKRKCTTSHDSLGSKRPTTSLSNPELGHSGHSGHSDHNGQSPELVPVVTGVTSSHVAPQITESEKPHYTADTSAHLQHYRHVVRRLLVESLCNPKLFTAQEKDHLRIFLSDLTVHAAALYSRLFSRKGPWLRTESCSNYGEIDQSVATLDAAIECLGRVGFIQTLTGTTCRSTPINKMQQHSERCVSLDINSMNSGCLSHEHVHIHCSCLRRKDLLLAVEALTVKELHMLSKLLGLTKKSGKDRLRETIKSAVRTQRTLFGRGENP